jgi:hypothetical protein
VSILAIMAGKPPQMVTPSQRSPFLSATPPPNGERVRPPGHVTAITGNLLLAKRHHHY